MKKVVSVTSLAMALMFLSVLLYASQGVPRTSQQTDEVSQLKKQVAALELRVNDLEKRLEDAITPKVRPLSIRPEHSVEPRKH